MNFVEPETPKAQLKLLYPDLKHIKTKVKLKFPNCDVHLFRIPCSVDPLLLLNKEINLEENCKINLGEKYIFEATTKLPDPALIVSDRSKILNLRKSFILTKHIKAKKQRDISIREKSVVKLPESLKARHPLFGLRFEDKIHLSEEVESKLDEAIASVIKRKMKEKKKKIRKIKQEQEDEHQNEVIYNLLNVQSISVPKIKTEVSDDSAFSSCSSSINLNRKNKTDEGYALDTKVLENIKQLECTYETDLEIKKHKKRKKDKKEKFTEQEIPETIKQDMYSLKETKHNKNSIANSTLMSDASRFISFSPNLSFITPATSDAVKKEEKSKRKHTISNILDDINSELPLSKKVKKKKRDRSLDY